MHCLWLLVIVQVNDTTQATIVSVMYSHVCGIQVNKPQRHLVLDMYLQAFCPNRIGYVRMAVVWLTVSTLFTDRWPTT